MSAVEGEENRPNIFRTRCYDGIWFPNFIPDSSIEGMKYFKVRPDDIWIVTYPKSGTHWIQEIIGLILADGRSEKIDRSLFVTCAEMIDTTQKLPRTLEEEAKNPVDMTPFLEKIDKAPSPRVIITHLRLDRMPRELLSKAKVVYAARNAKDACVSWYNFQCKAPFGRKTWEECFESFLDGKNVWGPWFEHVDEFWKKRDEENLIYLLYEDMMKDPVKCIRQIADHIKRPLSEETLQRVAEQTTLNAMKATYEQLARSGKASAARGGGEVKFLAQGGYGKWKRQFTVEQNEIFDKWYNEKMAATDLKFTME